MNISGYYPSDPSQLVDFFVAHATSPVKVGAREPLNSLISVMSASEGGTGLTLLVSMPSLTRIQAHAPGSLKNWRFKEKTIEAQPLNWVIKLGSRVEASNELFLTDLAHFLGFDAPKLTALTPADNAKMGKWRNRQTFERNQSLFYREGRQFILMKRCKAQNLTSFIDDGHIYNLTEEDYRKFFTTFGRIAIFDLLIGNDDRIVHHYLHGYDPLGSPFINSGNLMIQFDPNTQKIGKIYLIDNTSLRLFGPVEDEEDYIADRVEIALEALEKILADPNLLITHLIEGIQKLVDDDNAAFFKVLQEQSAKWLLDGIESALDMIRARRNEIKSFIKAHPEANHTWNLDTCSYMLNFLNLVE